MVAEMRYRIGRHGKRKCRHCKETIYWAKHPITGHFVPCDRSGVRHECEQQPKKMSDQQYYSRMDALASSADAAPGLVDE